MLNAVIFDFDGVLVDSEPLHYQAFVMVGKSIGVSFDYEQYLKQYIGFDDRDAFAHMIATLGREPKAGEIAKLCEAKQAVFEDLVGRGAAAVPGAVELVDELREAGVPIAIASGATRADIDLMLAVLGKQDAFEVIVTADDVAHSKPDPASYAMAVERAAQAYPDAGITPATALAIEDTAAGVTSAREAGLMALGVTTTGPASALFHANRVVEGMEAVTLSNLQKWFG